MRTIVAHLLYLTFGYVACLMTYASDTRMTEFLLHFVPLATALVIGDIIGGMLFKRGEA